MSDYGHMDKKWRRESDSERHNFSFTVDDLIDPLIPGEPVNDIGTDGVYLNRDGRWIVVFNNRVWPCQWPREYYAWAQECYRELCNPLPDDPAHFHVHPYNWEP